MARRGAESLDLHLSPSPFLHLVALVSLVGEERTRGVLLKKEVRLLLRPSRISSRLRETLSG